MQVLASSGPTLLSRFVRGGYGPVPQRDTTSQACFSNSGATAKKTPRRSGAFLEQQIARDYGVVVVVVVVAVVDVVPVVPVVSVIDVSVIVVIVVSVVTVVSVVL